MFTGLIETTGRVTALTFMGQSARLSLEAAGFTDQLILGESVAVNGCCLTVTEASATGVSFDLLAQTLQVTSLGDLQPGKSVNLERAAKLGSRLGGHIVQGHVDATVRVLDWRPSGQDHRLEVELPQEFRGLVIPKGSICLDGISLTAAEVNDQNVVCWIIPHTYSATHLHEKITGDRLNVEYDMLGKYVKELLHSQHAPTAAYPN
jgi:riboflavin synthase